MESKELIQNLEATGELKHIKSGKVREIFHFTDKMLLFVATDNISAFDMILPDQIPMKGQILTSLSKFWFQETVDICASHFVSTRLVDFVDLEEETIALIDGRSMLVERMTPILFECIVRGYLCGSAFREYKSTGRVGDISLPEGMEYGDKIAPSPLFTATTKAETGHDEPVSSADFDAALGADDAETIRRMSVELYDFAHRTAREAGVIVADTKFEFGYNRRGEICVMDEMLTPDSSRFWLRSDYVEGKRHEYYDKEYVRDYLVKSGWDKNPPAPHLPEEVITETSRRYALIHEKLTGRKL